MLRMFYHLNQLYEKEKSLIIDTILKYQSMKESAKENTSNPFKKSCFADETNKISQTKSVKEIVTPTNQIRMKKRCKQ